MATFTSRVPGIDPDQDVVVFASRLPLRRRREMPGFLMDTLHIKRQLDALIADPDEGLLWYALRADLRTNVYWTTSAWRDDEALRAFVIAEPHSSIMRARRGQLGGFESTRWTASGSDLPIAHGRTSERLTTPG